METAVSLEERVNSVIEDKCHFRGHTLGLTLQALLTA